VCVKWQRIITGLSELNKVTFKECFSNGEIFWSCIHEAAATNQPPLTADTKRPHPAASAAATMNHQPTARHSHSSAIVEHSLYVFGGLSDTNTSYNDLWVFNLNDKSWSRCNSTGSYPSPKAAATLTVHGSAPGKTQLLLLYGGYSHPHSHLFNQQVNFFDQLHTYCTRTHRWTQQVYCQEAAPRLAGHSASILHSNLLLLFGGCNTLLGNKTNAVHVFNLDTGLWVNVNGQQERPQTGVASKHIDGLAPDARFGHSQLSLDAERVLVVGGCAGEHKQYDDIWLLTWPQSDALNAQWQRVTVQNSMNSPTQLYFISIVQCDNLIVTLGKARHQQQHPTTTTRSLPNSELTIYGNVKAARPRVCSCAGGDNKGEESELTAAAAPHLDKATKRLEALNKVATNLRERDVIQQQLSVSKKKRFCVIHSKAMQVFVLNIEGLMRRRKRSDDDGQAATTNSQEYSVYWQVPIAHFTNAPGATVLYSLCKGIDEILLFGGLEVEWDSSAAAAATPYAKHLYRTKSVSNKLFILKPKSPLMLST
jgi:hypothetical protein